MTTTKSVTIYETIENYCDIIALYAKDEYGMGSSRGGSMGLSLRHKGIKFEVWMKLHKKISFESGTLSYIHYLDFELYRNWAPLLEGISLPENIRHIGQLATKSQFLTENDSHLLSDSIAQYDLDVFLKWLVDKADSTRRAAV